MDGAIIAMAGANDNPPSLLTPTLLVEVTMDSTEGDDRGKKSLHDQAIASLPVLSGCIRLADVYADVDLAEG